jgi:hypothetical protein
MLYFRDMQWMMIHGHSRFSAYIAPARRQRGEVLWNLQMQYRAAGARWRRVSLWKRPALHVQLSGFRAPATWSELERLNFWDPEIEDEEANWNAAGTLDVDYYPGTAADGREDAQAHDCLWRVAAREGRFFTVELAAFASRDAVAEAIDALPALVLPDGREARAEPEREFWQKHGELYLIENIPFGTVTVRVPRNARDPRAHAEARAAALLGARDPEHVKLTDFTKFDQSNESLHNDLYVEMHFHGYYEE